MKFYYHKDCVSARDKIKGTVRPEKLEFNEALQEAFTKFVQEILMELEVEGFHEKDLQECKRQNYHAESGLTIPVRCIKRKFLRICKQWAAI